ncbi:hypothetical protein HYH02_011979 [Chlamydomonas schloesseri]|uniref:Uroporphyrinogen decarboxylase n=1 Tax=Chlamydomonas schloesseri TaxID=2026947 RepID=A0A835W0Q9_9CHLO|nr:hypothetical protein HYH02_011979 [Chlamydomonas schloesseri]|eukprot:KAG2434980.1 hypothetical protein HYH02_011979 [Chlamydomonas schloesseri]
MQSSLTRQSAASRASVAPGRAAPRSRACTVACRAAGGQDPLLLRVARGEDAERTPVWLMRQAGRYMAAFREYSDKYPFRMRSETPDIAIELSLQPLRAFRPDGIIFFSDILTPLPGMGIEFDMVKGKGPVIANPMRSTEHLKQLTPLSDPASRLPFINTILSTLRKEADSNGVTLLGFIGTPWTLAAYSMEGKADKDCKETKKIMFHNPALLHSFLDFLTEQLIVYAGYQIESGAQVIQLFDSWAHHLSPAQFAEFSLPYMERITKSLKAKYPHVPVIMHANGGTGKLELMRDSTADVIGLDWAVDMKDARQQLAGKRVQGNVDPMTLFGTEEVIRAEVERCLRAAGPRGHILNVGHGVVQGTPESSVALFCQLARESGAIHAKAAANGARQPVLV